MSDGALQIGEVARRLGLSINTIRHWHETGLAPPSGRSPGGFRLYTDADVARLAFIKRFRPLGFGIEEIRDVLATRDALASGMPAEPLIECLEQYIAVANERCLALRSDLAEAESFVAELERDVAEGRLRGAAPRSSSAGSLARGCGHQDEEQAPGRLMSDHEPTSGGLVDEGPKAGHGRTSS
jgi:DNA-binding transcriptional MerR regulator